MVTKTASANLPTKYGTFRMHVYACSNGIEHVALVKGNIQNPMLVRLHSSCVTGDIFSSLKCDCGEQLEKSMEAIEKNGSGVILYLNQEGRGIGLTNKIKAYALQEEGYDTVEANTLLGLPSDARNYKVAADILEDLGIQKVVLLTNNPDKEYQLQMHGIEIVKRAALEIVPNEINRNYLKTKKIKMAHQLRYV
jgi:3,4-dihydroxy 2-butanone 4-phosphate synthase/GTP cyclohydrolase II